MGWAGDTRLFYAYYRVKDKRMVAGWNNVPPYMDIPTFPHHAHIRGRVVPWEEANLKDLLEYIEEEMRLR